MMVFQLSCQLHPGCGYFMLFVSSERLLLPTPTITDTGSHRVYTWQEYACMRVCVCVCIEVSHWTVFAVFCAYLSENVPAEPKPVQIWPLKPLFLAKIHKSTLFNCLYVYERNGKYTTFSFLLIWNNYNI